MSVMTGQRIGDVLGIKQSDISEDGISFKQQKSKKRLLVEMTPELAEVVREARGLSKVAGVHLFSDKGKRYDYHRIRRHWLAACRKAKVEDANIHDLRRKAITDADMAGEDAQKLAGHTSRAMTERYLQLLRTDRVKPVKIK